MSSSIIGIMPPETNVPHDPNIRPGDDFFHYVNGEWISKNPIPADEAQWGSFYTLRFDVEGQVRTLLDELSGGDTGAPAREFAPGSDEQRVRDFYKSTMDVEKRNQLGVAPLAEIFAKIDAIVEHGLFGDSLLRAIGDLHRLGVDVFWNAISAQDEKQSDVMALHFWQGGLSLPDRDYYLNDDEKTRKIREDFVVYMKDMLARAGLVQNVDLAKAADTIMAIEKRLAVASLSQAELRDVEKMYHKVTLAEFAVLAPQISLADYFKGIAPWSEHIDAGETSMNASFEPAYLIVGQPKFFTEVNEILEHTPLEDVKLYLRWHFLNGIASYLSEEFERRYFDFYGVTFNGAKEMKPLWRRALRATEGALGEMLGKLYVARHFGEEAKRKIKDLVEHLVIAYRGRIEKLDWMSEETKKKAIEKLGVITKKLGYPDVWKNYEGLMIDPGLSFVENVLRAQTFEFDRKMKEVGGPVNRDEWQMSPQTVNAYCDLVLNEVVFPAAILRPPFFDPAAEDAMNFGAIGATIGHELTHAFDDQGSRFDLHGNLHEWWTPEDKAQFDARAAQLAAQFDAYAPFPDVHVNGKLTLGENIADLGGLLIAYDGLKLAMGEKFSLDAAQKFFIGCAMAERGYFREERARFLLQIDPHSPAQFRVNGPVSNMDEFYQAFGVREGDKLWRKPEERVRIW